MATLSVVFAFLFAPAGAVLGHLGLAQIRRTGQPGRSRALLGIVASYAIIAVGIVAVTAWAILRPSGAGPVNDPAKPSAGPASMDLVKYLPTTDEMQKLVSDPYLDPQPPATALANTPGNVDHPECWALTSIGDPRVYDASKVRAFYRTNYTDPPSSPRGFEIDQSIAVYASPDDAMIAAQKIVADLKDCFRVPVKFTGPAGQTATLSGTDPEALGKHISKDWVMAMGSQPMWFIDRVVTHKGDMVIDAMGKYIIGFEPRTVEIAEAILAKIPG